MNERIFLGVLLAMALLLAPGKLYARYLNTVTGRFQTMDNVTGRDDEYAVKGWGNQWTVDSKGNWTMKRGKPFKNSWADVDNWADTFETYFGP